MNPTGNGSAGNGKPDMEELRRMELAILDGIPPAIAAADEQRLQAADPKLGPALQKLECWGKCTEAAPCANCLIRRQKLALELHRERFGKPVHPSDAAGYPESSDAHEPEPHGDAHEDPRDRLPRPSANGNHAPAIPCNDEPWQTPIPLDEIPDAAEFPLDTLPGSMQAFVQEAAWALNCPPDYLAVPMLALAGAAVGARRELEIKSGWRNQPCLYAAVVGPPGSAKTPALKLIAKPFYHAQGIRHKAWEGAKRAWQEGNEEGQRPKLESLFVSDITTEALAVVLQDNPSGLGMIRDELVAWVSGLDQYRARGRGADRQFYLSAWAGETISIHRKNQDDGPLFVQYPFLAVVGGLPPDCLEKLRGERGVSDGFLDRVLFTYPKPLPAVGETWRSVSEEGQTAWSDILAFLWGLQQDTDGTSPRPKLVHLDDTGRKAWVRFTNHLAAATNAPELPAVLNGPYAKLKGYGARLALIVHLLHLAAGEADGETINGAMMDKAAVLIGYFQSHAHKVYAVLGTDGDADTCKAILAWIKREGVSQFKGWQAHKDCKTADRRRVEDFHGPLDRLVKLRYLRPLPAPERSGRGRHPDPGYEVNPLFLTVGRIG